MLSRIIIDGLAFEAIDAKIEFGILGTKHEIDVLASSPADVPFTTSDGTMGIMSILEIKSTPSLAWPNKSLVKVKAHLRLKG